MPEAEGVVDEGRDYEIGILARHDRENIGLIRVLRLRRLFRTWQRPAIDHCFRIFLKIQILIVETFLSQDLLQVPVPWLVRDGFFRQVSFRQECLECLQDMSQARVSSASTHLIISMLAKIARNHKVV